MRPSLEGRCAALTRNAPSDALSRLPAVLAAESIMRHPSTAAAAWFLPAALALAPGVARAQDVWDAFPLPKSDWRVFSGLTHSDNVTKSPDAQADTIATVGATGAFFKDGGRLRANVRATAWYDEYLDNTYDGQLLGALAATVRYDLLPERLSWVFDDTYGQTTSNTFQPATPGNRANANFLSTGPDATLRFGPVAGLRVGARYERNTYDDGTLDENRYRANAMLFRRFSGTTTGSINASAARTEYQGGTVTLASGQTADRYDIRELYGRWEMRRARYALSFDAGSTEVEQKGAKERSPLGRLTFYRRLSPSFNLNLSAGQEYRSGADILRDSINGVRIVNNQVVYIPPGLDPAFVFNVIADLNVRSQPIKYQSARASIDYVGPRTTVNVGGSTGRERFQFAGQNLDRDVWDAGVAVTRRLWPTLTGTLAANYYDRKFLNLPNSDRNTAITGQVSWQVTSQFALNGGYRYERRRSDVDLFSYSENLVYVGVTFGRPRTAAGLPASLTPGAAEPTPSPVPNPAMPVTPRPTSTGGG
jgi:hypothetical protein